MSNVRPIRTTRQMGLFQELIVDSFAGGGGASTGIEWAMEQPVDIAINHDATALAMHEANHPLTRHYCENVWDVDPREVTEGKPVGLAWFSPDCKHFSKAKGGQPREQKIRGLAWVALRWAATVGPRVIFLENVEEFLDWGPLIAGQPDKKQKGRTFRAFVNALKRHGYAVEWKLLRACDFGAPTTRKRLFLIARRDGQAIVWPEPTHGSPKSEAVKSGLLKPWRTAAECIDWSIPTQSIFDRKRPLAEATLRRIARGIQKFILEAKEPFIVTCNHGGDGFRGQGLGEPFKTITGARDAHGLVTAQLMHYRDQPGGAPRVQDLDAPLGTVTGGGVQHSMVMAELVQVSYGERKGQAPRVPGLDKPLGTIVAQGMKHALAVATLIKNYGGNYTGAGLDLNEPIHTVTATDHHSLVSACLVRQFGTSNGADIGEPVGTIMADGCGKTQLVEAFLMKYFGRGEGSGLDGPAHTITSKDRLALVTINSVDYIIVDIGLRMLEPHELFRAQGFPDNYCIKPIVNGKPLSKTAQVRMVGNSVSPCVARALVTANMVTTKVKTKRMANV